jgi:hypothetical protein
MPFHTAAAWTTLALAEVAVVVDWQRLWRSGQENVRRRRRELQRIVFFVNTEKEKGIPQYSARSSASQRAASVPVPLQKKTSMDFCNFFIDWKFEFYFFIYRNLKMN